MHQDIKHDPRLKKIQQHWSTAGITQQEAALKFKITQSAVCQYLKGTIPLNTDIIIKFAHLYQVAPHQLDTRLKF